LKGFFITMEGTDGSGKTTQIELLARYLDEKGIKNLVTREPGGTRIGDRIREILLEKEYTEMRGETEVLLYAASRAQHVAQVILPALKEGYTVLCDRFVDASIAYQGEGRGIDADRIVGINEIATMGLKPHLTILLDIDPRTGLKRKRNKQNRDRMEKEEIEFYDRVRRGYLKLAEREPERIKKVDASRDEAAVHSEIVIIIENLFKRDK